MTQLEIALIIVSSMQCIVILLVLVVEIRLVRVLLRVADLGERQEKAMNALFSTMLVLVGMNGATAVMQFLGYKWNFDKGVVRDKKDE